MNMSLSAMPRSKPTKFLVLLILAGMVFQARSEYAPSLFSLDNVSGSVRAGLWSSNRLLDDQQNMLPASIWLKFVSPSNNDLRVVVDAWAGNTDFAGNGPRGLIREAYFETSAGLLDVRVGRQIIAWGRADKLNPTDNLTPRNTTLLAVDDDDQRWGEFALKAVANFSGTKFIGAWLPTFSPDRLPLPANVPQSYPEHEHSWALKLDREGGEFDWSISYYDGMNHTPDIAVNPSLPLASGVYFQYFPIRVVGSDFSTTISGWGLRGEVAHIRTTDPEGRDPLVANSSWYAVAGIERKVLSDWNINIQGFRRSVQTHQPLQSLTPELQPLALQAYLIADQRDAQKHGYTLRISRRWLNDTLDAELLWIKTYPRHDYATRAKLSYALDDHFRITFGTDQFRGSDDSYLGRLRLNSTTYAQLAYSF